MTEQQESTLKDLMLIIPVMVNDKFRRGDKEHGSDIQDMTVTDLMDNLSDELVDAIIYALLAVKKLREIKAFTSNRPKIEPAEVLNVQ
jgi:hypothetical protein